jgi:hypothetical protein
MSRSDWILESLDGDFEPCHVSEFIDANKETFSAAEIRTIRKLRPGQKYSGGGGAWGSWTVRRQALDLQRNGLPMSWMIALVVAAAGGIYLATRETGAATVGHRALVFTSLASEYAAALREFASAKGFRMAALLRKTDHPQDAALATAYDAANDRFIAATAHLEAARAAMTQSGLPT